MDYEQLRSAGLAQVVHSSSACIIDAARSVLLVHAAL